MTGTITPYRKTSLSQELDGAGGISRLTHSKDSETDGGCNEPFRRPVFQQHRLLFVSAKLA
jgi:hypothetical protein